MFITISIQLWRTGWRLGIKGVQGDADVWASTQIKGYRWRHWLKQHRNLHPTIQKCIPRGNGQDSWLDVYMCDQNDKRKDYSVRISRLIKWLTPYVEQCSEKTKWTLFIMLCIKWIRIERPSKAKKITIRKKSRQNKLIWWSRYIKLHKICSRKHPKM